MEFNPSIRPGQVPEPAGEAALQKNAALQQDAVLVTALKQNEKPRPTPIVTTKVTISVTRKEVNDCLSPLQREEVQKIVAMLEIGLYGAISYHVVGNASA